MDRRAFLAGTLAVAAARRVAGAQPAGKLYQVGLIGVTPVARIMSDPTHPINSGFRREMRDRGYVEGKNFVLELRSVEGRIERTSGIVAELARLNVDVVVTTSSEMTREAGRATSTLPIVMAGSRDPVEAGFAASLARPGGNITGLTIDVGVEVPLLPEHEGMSVSPRDPRWSRTRRADRHL